MQQSIFESMAKAYPGQIVSGGTMEYESQDITAAHHHGNEFSVAANRSIKHVKAQLRDRVYAFIRSRGELGSTSEECELAFNMSHTTIGPRFTELKALDRIELTGRRPNVSGRTAGVYRVI